MKNLDDTQTYTQTYRRQTYITRRHKYELTGDILTLHTNMWTSLEVTNLNYTQTSLQVYILQTYIIHQHVNKLTGDKLILHTNI